MKIALFIALLSALLHADFYLLDGKTKLKLAAVEGPAFNEKALENLPHIRRNSPTLTLLYEGKEYNHRHLNVRTATIEPHPTYTVLTEYSKALDPTHHRIAFNGYTFSDRLVLQVYYRGKWYAALLDALKE